MEISYHLPSAFKDQQVMKAYDVSSELACKCNPVSHGQVEIDNSTAERWDGKIICLRVLLPAENAQTEYRLFSDLISNVPPILLS